VRKILSPLGIKGSIRRRLFKPLSGDLTWDLGAAHCTGGSLPRAASSIIMRRREDSAELMMVCVVDETLKLAGGSLGSSSLRQLFFDAPV
jgi:hypothetical protein